MHHPLLLRVMHPLPNKKGTNSKGRIAKWLKQRVHSPTSWVRIPLQMVPCFISTKMPTATPNGLESDPMQRSGRRSTGGLGLAICQASCERHQQQFLVTTTTRNRTFGFKSLMVPCITNSSRRSDFHAEVSKERSKYDPYGKWRSYISFHPV